MQVVRDPALGVIGVGESTTPNVPTFLFEYLGIDPRHFYAVAKPTWKIGIHFLWGPRPHFEYSFMQQLDAQWTDLPMPNGFYCDDDFSSPTVRSALMAQGKAFRRAAQRRAGHPAGARVPHRQSPICRGARDGRPANGASRSSTARCRPPSAARRASPPILLKDGRRLAADFFIDASGFRSELLGKALGEPFISFASRSICDRAIVGGWERTDEPILPYTTAETMDAGWCWQIEHEKQINRGYVYCSSAHLRRRSRAPSSCARTPRPRPGAIVKFRSGRYQRGWVDNVVAIGNAGGFVEPLEATALMIVCAQCQTLVASPAGSEPHRPRRPCGRLYNEVFASTLGRDPRFPLASTTASIRVWTRRSGSSAAPTSTSPASQRLLEFYEENGPTRLCRYLVGHRGQEIGVHSAFGVEGYLVLLTGNKVPYKKQYTPTDEEWQRWKTHKIEPPKRPETA